MTYREMQEAIIDGINQKRIYAIVRDNELKFFHASRLSRLFAQQEADNALTADQYLALSNADYYSREN